VLVASLGALANAGAAPGRPGPGAVAAQDPDASATGRDLYVSGCSSCHGLDGQGSERGPSLQGVGAAAVDFYLTTGRMPADRDQRQAPRGEPEYDAEEIATITAYVVDAFGTGIPIPDVDPERGSLSEGAQLYASNCAACHSSSAAGGALGEDVFATSLRDSTAVQVAEAVRIGPGAMPVFGPETLRDDELDSIVRYVQYLRDPDDRGGYPLGRLGPVPEGFVAWFVGLGLMLLAARWIGTRT
jgi:ubiquinol-cytochrome c reductase cytochrome c subunit